MPSTTSTSPAVTAGTRAERRPTLSAPTTHLLRVLAALGLAILLTLAFGALPATAQGLPGDPSVPAQSGGIGTTPATGDGPEAQFSLDLGDTVEEPSQSLVIILMLTVISLAPSLLVMMTAFTRIVIVLSVVRQALGLPTVPPTQVVVGLSLFLSLFVMAPTFSEINEIAVQPVLNREIETVEAIQLGQGPLREFMLRQVGEQELAMFVDASGEGRPASDDDLPLTTLIPAFVLSELKAAFIIAFVIFVPFLVVDLITASVLMSMGMMMLPPVLVSLPFKLLLFVMVDGWTLVIQSLLESFAT